MLKFKRNTSRSLPRKVKLKDRTSKISEVREACLLAQANVYIFDERPFIA